MKNTKEKYVGTCLKGLEEVCCEVCDGKKLTDGRVVFSKLSKYGCFDKIYKLEGKFRFVDLDELVGKVKICGKYKIVCSRQGEHNFNSVEVVRRLAEKFELDFAEKKSIIIDIVNDNCFYGELIYSDMCKREYRVKLNAETINPCLAFCMLKLLGVKKDVKILDPYCRDGVILIEAAMLGAECFGFSGNIRNARINAKVANVSLNLEEKDLSWMKTRFKENEVLICSYLPSVSQRKRERMIFGLYRAFFENAFVAKKLCLLCCKDDILKFGADFQLKKKILVEKGEGKYFVFLLERKNI